MQALEWGWNGFRVGRAPTNSDDPGFGKNLRSFLRFLDSVLPLSNWQQSETKYIVSAASFITDAGITMGVEWFLGPLWAAKFR